MSCGVRRTEFGYDEFGGDGEGKQVHRVQRG